MARCDLRIELEPGKNVWTLGDVVRGEVVAGTDGDVRCNGLKVMAAWGTHGKGNPAVGPGEWITLWEGEWAGGPERRYPFELRLPQTGPSTYNGHYLNVGWFVHATADIPWKIDPTTRAEISVVPAPGVEPDWRAQFQDENRVPAELRAEKPAPDPAQKEAGIGGKILGWVILLGCLAILLGILGGIGGALWGAISQFREVLAGERGWGEAIESLVVLGIAALVLLAIVGAIVRVQLRRRWLGEVRLSVEPQVARPGDEIRITIAGQPHRALELNRATVQLTGREEVVRGSGTNKTTYKHEIHDETVELGGARPLQARIPYQLSGTVRLPDHAPPSFGADSNELVWKLDVALDVARCPDWSQEKALVVTPRR